MAINFDSLKKNRKSLSEQILTKSQRNTNSYDDDRFWVPTKDAAGNASAVIRFLPIVDGDDAPWCEYFSHSFKNKANNRWYIENSLTSLGQEDPVGKVNSHYWNLGKEGQKIARSRKRKRNFITNVYIVNDPKKPENNGKVKLYRFGVKVFDKINQKMHPEFEGDEPMIPFDFWEGANFRLKIRLIDVDGEKMPNYDLCEFDAPTPLSDNDDELRAIYEQQYRLSDLVKFKTYDELLQRLIFVLGEDEALIYNKSAIRKEQVATSPMETAKSSKQKPAFEAAPEVEDPPFDTDDSDDEMAFFNNLAKDD